MLRGWDEGYDIPSFGVCVRPDVRGRGIARRLLSDALEPRARRGRVSCDAQGIRREFDGPQPVREHGFRFRGASLARDPGCRHRGVGTCGDDLGQSELAAMTIAGVDHVSAGGALAWPGPLRSPRRKRIGVLLPAGCRGEAFDLAVNHAIMLKLGSEAAGEGAQIVVSGVKGDSGAVRNLRRLADNGIPLSRDDLAARFEGRTAGSRASTWGVNANWMLGSTSIRATARAISWTVSSGTSLRTGTLRRWRRSGRTRYL